MCGAWLAWTPQNKTVAGVVKLPEGIKTENQALEWNKSLIIPIRLSSEIQIPEYSTNKMTTRLNIVNSRLKVTALRIKNFKVFFSINFLLIRIRT